MTAEADIDAALSPGADIPTAEEALARLNSHRNPIRRQFDLSLVFVGAPWLQEVVTLSILPLHSPPPAGPETWCVIPRFRLRPADMTSSLRARVVLPAQAKRQSPTTSGRGVPLVLRTPPGQYLS